MSNHASHFDTLIWYIKKQKWGLGPSIPNEKRGDSRCALALNKSSAAFLGGYAYSGMAITSVDVFNFDLSHWENLPELQLSEPYYFQSCSAVLYQDKANEKSIFLLLNVANPFESGESMILKSLDLNQNEWETHVTFLSNNPLNSNSILLEARGNIFIVSNYTNGTSSDLKNLSFIKTSVSGTQQEDNKEDIVAARVLFS